MKQWSKSSIKVTSRTPSKTGQPKDDNSSTYETIIWGKEKQSAFSYDFR